MQLLAALLIGSTFMFALLLHSRSQIVEAVTGTQQWRSQLQAIRSGRAVKELLPAALTGSYVNEVQGFIHGLPLVSQNRQVPFYFRSHQIR